MYLSKMLKTNFEMTNGINQLKNLYVDHIMGNII